MKPTSTALIVGGSSGLGRALAELLAKKGFGLALVSRDKEDLQALQSSLQTVHGVRVFIYPTDLLDPALSAERVVEKVSEDLGSIDYAFLVAGGSFTGDEKVPSLSAFSHSLRLNFEAIGLFMNAILLLREKAVCRSILVISSIAAVAPRSQNSSYAAAKKALESYAISLRHYCFQAQIPTNIQVVRLGYMESGFTRGKTLLFPIAKPQAVAQFIFKLKDRDFGLRVFPSFWNLILFILTKLPWAVYKRLRF
ncbi:MAG TPA: SDR family NAD(P)-dependent oxidoreductase [Pseudobdellovibrionaceae bacterium]|jgi:short-subunit dehydrogenase